MAVIGHGQGLTAESVKPKPGRLIALCQVGPGRVIEDTILFHPAGMEACSANTLPRSACTVFLSVTTALTLPVVTLGFERCMPRSPDEKSLDRA